MFCHHCGRELPDTAKFCSGCGAPADAAMDEAKVDETQTAVIPNEEPVPAGNEVPVDAPAEENAEAAEVLPEEVPAPAEAAPEAGAVVCAPVVAAAPIPGEVAPLEKAPALGGSKRRGKSLVLLAVILAVLAALVVGAIKIVPALFGGKGAYLYVTDDGELMSLKKLKAGAEATELTDEGVQLVLFSKDGKYIYFIEPDDSNGNLYRMELGKIGKKGAEPEKVSSDVQYDIRLLDSGGVVYLKGSGSDAQLRLYDGKESYKLSSGVTGFSMNEKQTYAYFTEEEYGEDHMTYTLYRVELKKDAKKEKVLSEVGTFYGDYAAETLVYGKHTDDFGVMDVYVAKNGEKGTKVLDDVWGVENVEVSGQKVSFDFLTCQTEEHVLYDFVTDRLESQDKNIGPEPDYSDYRYYGSWGWIETDWDAYYAAWETWSEARDRNYIRDELKSTAYNFQTFTLSRYEDGKVTQVADGLTSSYYNGDAQNKVYVYSKTEQTVSKVADVSELSYWGNLYDFIETGDRQYYQNIKGTESELDIDEDEYIDGFGVLNGKEVILVVSDGETREIRGYELGDKAMKFSGTITDDEYAGMRIYTQEDGKDALYYFTDLNKDKDAGELIRYANGKKETVAKDAERVVIVDGKTIYQMEDIQYNAKIGAAECTLSLVENGKAKEIAEEVSMYTVAYLDAKRVAYISDGDLYLWDGSKSERIASDVVRFWTNERVSGEKLAYFSCSYYYD